MTRRLTSIFLLCICLSACAQTQPLPISTKTTEAPTPQAAPADWWTNAVFYEIFVRSFSDSDRNGMGDFNGITQKLDYVEELGITAIWLMPIHPSPSYHGYDVINYYAVNPDYGTMQDFKHLLSAAHKRDIRIIIDLVLNHTSDQHPFFVDANGNLDSPYRNWYIWSATSQGNYWHEGKNGYYYGYFSSGMPDLNYRNPDVTAQMENVVRFWLNDVGVDGFRIDAAKHLIEEDGKLENTRSTHDWYQGFYQYYKSINPNAYTVGEAFGAGAFIAKTYENQFDHIFNFEFASGFIAGARAGTNIPVSSAIQFALKDNHEFNFATFLTNHDQNRVMSQLGNNADRAKVAASLLLTSPGTPFIYYGEEIGMTGTKPDENIRRPMQWSAEENAGFTTGKPWRAPDTNFASVNVHQESIDPQSLLSHYRSLIHVRNDHSALRTGAFHIVKSNTSEVYAALRTDEEETLLVLLNLSDKSLTDYTLSLSDAVLSEKSYQMETLFGDEQAQAPEVTQGVFQGYKPVATLKPYSTILLQLRP